jgi:HD superfamily phosphodiesterase
MIYTEALSEIESHVSQLFKKHETKTLSYHNLQHTEEVVKYAKEIATHEKISNDDRFILLAATWFHDTGQLFTAPDEHVAKSIEVMKSFFAQKEKYPAETIDKIGKLIQYSEYTTEPVSPLEEILHDADTYHLGTDDFKKLNKKLKKEEQLRGNGNGKDMNWKQNTLEFLQQHTYYTQYCKNLLEGKKLEYISKKMQDSDNLNGMPTLLEEDKKSQSEKIKGIQTMMRVINDNHIEFSSIADNKANLLISVNAIMISVILSVLVRRLEVDTHLIIPTIIFLVVAVTTIVLAILSTKPKVTSGMFKREDILARKVNLMFFGNFHKTDVNDYEWAMREVMNDPDYLYGNLIKDVHQLGVVLAKKYRLVSAAYLVFMYGIIVTILAFVIAIIFGQPVSTAPTPL